MARVISILAASLCSLVAEDKAEYLLGPHDELAIWSLNAEEFAGQTIQIDSGGYFNAPLIGRFRAAGLTVSELEAELARKLAAYVHDPQVSVNVTEFRSQPVSVIGAVNQPGVHHLRGPTPLVEVLSMAGGMKEEASHSIRITRRKQYGVLDLPLARSDATSEFSVAEVSLEAILDGSRPEENIEILPHDVISVPKADMVYVIGQVQRAGAFVLDGKERITVLKALSLAGGTDREASPGGAKILRSDKQAQERVELAVDVKRILQGKDEDIALQPEDILFIPGSTTKKVTMRAIETLVSTLSGIVIWRGGRF